MKNFAFLSFLRSASYPERLTDEKVIKEQYRYWRIRTFYAMFSGYALFYFTRKSFTFAMASMSDELGLNMATLGLLGTVLYLTYGVSKIISGVLSDYANPRYFMSLGLIMTGAINIFFGMSSSLVMLAFLWGLNGFFQGWGWPACTKQLTYWYPKKTRGKWWSLQSTSHNIGGALIPLLMAFLIQQGDWRLGMQFTGGISILCGFWLMNRMRDVPESLGLPAVEPVSCEKAGKDSKKNLSLKQTVFGEVMSRPIVWILAMSYFFVYIIRTAMNDWCQIYLIKSKGYDVLTAASSITWFEVGGFVGILVAGWASDHFFKGRRVAYMAYCCLGLIASLLGLWFLPSGFLYFEYFLIGMSGFLVFGPQLLVGLAAAEFVDKRAACTANGFAGCFAYIGAAATGYPLGAIIDQWGWNGFFGVLLISAVICSVIFLALTRDIYVMRKKSNLSSLEPEFSS